MDNGDFKNPRASARGVVNSSITHQWKSATYIKVRDTPQKITREIAKNVWIDLDEDGQVIGIEILDLQ